MSFWFNKKTPRQNSPPPKPKKLKDDAPPRRDHPGLEHLDEQATHPEPPSSHQQSTKGREYSPWPKSDKLDDGALSKGYFEDSERSYKLATSSRPQFSDQESTLSRISRFGPHSPQRQKFQFSGSRDSSFVIEDKSFISVGIDFGTT